MLEAPYMFGLKCGCEDSFLVNVLTVSRWKIEQNQAITIYIQFSLFCVSHQNHRWCLHQQPNKEDLVASPALQSSTFDRKCHRVTVNWFSGLFSQCVLVLLWRKGPDAANSDVCCDDRERGRAPCRIRALNRLLDVKNRTRGAATSAGFLLALIKRRLTLSLCWMWVTWRLPPIRSRTHKMKESGKQKESHRPAPPPQCTRQCTTQCTRTAGQCTTTVLHVRKWLRAKKNVAIV